MTMIMHFTGGRICTVCGEKIVRNHTKCSKIIQQQHANDKRKKARSSAKQYNDKNIALIHKWISGVEE